MKLKREVKVGIFVIVTIALFIWGFNFLKGNNILKLSRNYYALYDDIGGLKNANPVFYKGFKIGLVDEIILSGNKKHVIVSISIKEDLDIPVDSKFMITDVGLLGSKALELHLGKSDKYAELGDTLGSGINKGMMGEVMTFKDKIDSTLLSINNVLMNIEAMTGKEMKTDLEKTMGHIENTTSAISANSTNISGIIQNLSELIASINQKNEEIQNIITNISNVSDSLAAANLQATIENTNEAIVQVNELLEKAKGDESTIGKLFNDKALYENLTNASNSLDSLLVDLKENPKRYVHFSLFGKKEKEE